MRPVLMSSSRAARSTMAAWRILGFGGGQEGEQQK